MPRHSLAPSHDETDVLFSTHPRDLAARFGRRTIELIRAGQDVYEMARCAASYALIAEPSLRTMPVLDGRDAAVLAAAIEYNCDRLRRGDIDQAEWGQEQNRLYALAVEGHCTAEVIRICCPSLTRPR